MPKPFVPGMKPGATFSRMKNMPVKPPRGGGSHVDVPTSPNRSANADQSLPGQSGRRSVDSGSTQDNLQPRAGSSSESSRDEVRPVAAVVVHASSTAVHRPEPLLSLDDYATNARAILPQVNEDGLRVINRRTYADHCQWRSGSCRCGPRHRFISRPAPKRVAAIRPGNAARRRQRSLVSAPEG